jgi:predicted amino acid dehydrogenase
MCRLTQAAPEDSQPLPESVLHCGLRMKKPERAWTAGLALAATGALALARRAKRFDLRGRVAVVTGGSRGLGLVLARELSGRGARIVLVARDGEELERARMSLRDDRSLNAEVLALGCDVSDRRSVQDAMKQAEA